MPQSLWRTRLCATGWFSPDPGNVGADPSDPQTWNMYAYVRNNPTSFVDPLGLFANCPSGVIRDGQCTQASSDDDYVDDMDWPDTILYAEAYYHPPSPGSSPASSTGGASAQPPLVNKRAKLNTMVDKVWSCLAQDPGCLWWLGSLGGDPLARLSSGNFTVRDQGPGGPSAQTPVSTSGPLSAGQTVVNSQGAFFSSGYVFQGAGQIPSGASQGQALMLLHEVGHATGVLPPDPTNAGQAANNRAVVSHCSKTIKCCGGQ
jgi:hypothetical protein